MKYCRKPVVVEAIVWDGENVSEVKQFCGAAANIHYQYDNLTPDIPNVIVVLDTPEGRIHVSRGSYIMRDEMGRFHSIFAKVFEEEYEEV